MDPNQLPQPGQTQSPVPQAPAPTQLSGQFNPSQYDFITSPGQPQKKSLLPTHGSSKKQRTLIVLGGLLILLIVGILFMSLLNSGQRSNTEQLKTILVQQSELSRVSNVGKTKASSEDAKALAATSDIIILSQQNQLKSILAQQKIEIKEKDLLGGRNTETDQTLTTAEKNGRFDDAFIQAMRSELEKYQQSLKTGYSGSKSQSVRKLLDENYTQVSLILTDITKQ